MRDRLQRGKDFVLRRTEGIDEDVSICRFGGFVEDGDGGEAGGGQEGEVGRGGAGVGYSGGFGLEVEAYEAILEAPVDFMSGLKRYGSTEAGSVYQSRNAPTTSPVHVSPCPSLLSMYFLISTLPL